MTDLTAQTIRGYHVREKIGEGGYGAVYKAYQSAVDREAAIKVILPEHASKPEFAQRFDTEARLVAKLEHPHIVPLYDYWRDDSGAYLVMRWLPTSLRSTLKRQGALSLAHCARLLDQIAGALAVAHQGSVIHRDLKPDNILLDERGNAYLTDFGIAKRLDGSANITATDAIIGTPAYLAPEQIQSISVTPQTDIYALGVMLYEMLAGEHPFATTPVMMQVMKHLQEPLPLLCEKRPDVPTAIDAVIQQATAKNPAERYPDAPAVADAFRAAVAGAPAVGVSREIAVPAHNRIPDTPEQRNRHNMLQNVRRFWIEGVLENSLHGAALIELGMKQSSGTIDHAWDSLLRIPGSPDETLPSGTQIIDVFDKLNGKLLILGEPGGGKTTTLLELAQALLYRADFDEAHPIPVIFNLSSWSENRKPLVDWLVDELSSKYQVPKKVAQHWVESDALLLLLDGLDEVTADGRETCVQVINAYRAEHGFVDVVVCSRTADYEALTGRLKLNGAIVIQPLDDAQIDRYLSSLGTEMNVVRRMLANDGTMRDMAHSPLMLNILALAYRGASAEDLPKLDSPEAQRKHIFDVYVQRMFERRVGEKLYTQEQTVHYLSWLAWKMQKHGQSIFQIEKMQPTWLTPAQWQRYYSRFLLVIFLQSLFFASTAAYLLALVLGLIPWLMALLVGLANVPGNWVFASGRLKHRVWLLTASIAVGIGWGVGIGATYGLAAGVISTVIFSAVYSVGNLADARSLAHVGTTPNHIVTIERLRFVQSKVNPWAAIGGFINGAVVLILFTVILRLDVTVIPMITGIVLAGSILALLQVRESGLTTSEIELRIRPNQGIWDSLINAISVGLVNGVGVLVAGTCGFAPLGFFNIGVNVGLGFGLLRINAAWLAFGGQTIEQHIMLRQALYRDGAIPQNYARLLDYATSLIFLRKVGGSYIFVHRYLLEYFAGRELT